MNLIVAVDKNWAIGYQNKLLVSIPEDMKFFRTATTGKVVVMEMCIRDRRSRKWDTGFYRE